jgi:tetratricopeptide (TPR) repeat protein
MDSLQIARMRPSLLAALLAALWAARPAHAADDPVTEAVRHHTRNALSQASSPRGAAHLGRLHRLRDEVEDLTTISSVLSTVSERRTVDPFTRFTARLLWADVERARGRLPRAQELVRSMGFITDFHVVGSFDNEGKAGCQVDHGPETNLDLQATYPARSREVGWRRVPVRPLDGYVDLGAMLRPSREAVGYAVTVLQSPEEAVTTLGVGSSGAFRLWVNGQLAASEDRYNLPRPDQARVAVRLRRGPNRILLKVCNASGPFGFYLRSESPSVIAVPADTLPPLEKGPGPAPVRLPTLASALEKEVQARPRDAALRGDYAMVLDLTRAFDERDHSDRVQATQAADLAPGDVGLQLLAADLHHEDHNLRRKYLEAAVRASPGHLLARYALARHELARNHPERTLALAADLVKESPRFFQARLVLARAYEALGDEPRAAGVVEQALRDFPRAPGVVREAARSSRRYDRQQESLDRLRLALALRYDDGGSRRGAASILADLARVADAGRELEVQVGLEPFEVELRLRLAELYASNGRVEDADRLFALARQISPDEPEIHERHGRALLEAGRQQDAVAAFERALQLRPQNPALREVVRSLKGEEKVHGAELLVDVRAIAGEADTFAGEDAVYLADHTYVRVQPSGLSSRFHQVAVKVFNQRGVDAFRSFPITYSPNRQEVRVVRARVTKADGTVAESYGESDRNINEPWSGMYYDARAKVLSFPQLAAGDVLELQYRLEDTAQENLLSDYWGDVDYVQTTSPKLRYQYFVDMPASRPLYWNQGSLPPGVEHAQAPAPGDRVLYRWTARNVSKVVPEPDMPGWAEVVPTLHVSTYQTWEQVGRYYWGLVRDQVIPNDDIRKVTATVLEGVDRKDERAVIRAIYNFVVTNTRYVALEFGIHGYKPYRVDRVLARRFGDCKDKASLIHAMLKVAGVESRLVLLRMRNLGAIGREPASLAAFNHAIAYVPKYQLFLDGTAEFHGSRELPALDRAASILVVEPDGPSTFTATPEAAEEDNTTALTLKVALAPEGSASVSGETKVSGQSAPGYRRAYQAANARRSTFEQSWAQTFPGLRVKDVRLTDLSLLEQDVGVSFEMEIPRYAEVLQGGGLRFSPFGSSRNYTQTYAPLTERRFDLVMQSPWVNRLRFAYQLPPGFTAREVPPPVKEESPFGRLAMGCEAAGASAGGGATLVCDVEVALTATRVKPADYPAFRAFLGRMDQAFARKVLVQGPAAGAGAAP